MQVFLLIFIRGLRGPYGKGLVGHCTSGHSFNPPLPVRCRELARIFRLQDEEVNHLSAILLDLYFYTVQFARDCQFTKEQTSAFFSIVKRTHDACVGLCTHTHAFNGPFPAGTTRVSRGGSVAEWLACCTHGRRAQVQIVVATLSDNSLRQTVHTHRASVHQAAKLVAALLMVAGVTVSLAESNGSLPPGL